MKNDPATFVIPGKGPNDSAHLTGRIKATTLVNDPDHGILATITVAVEKYEIVERTDGTGPMLAMTTSRVVDMHKFFADRKVA